MRAKQAGKRELRNRSDSFNAVENVNQLARQSFRHRTIVREIGIAIVSGRYRSGDLIVGEVHSRRALQVGRSSYREVLRTLAAKGLVQSKPKVGTTVNPKSKWNLLDPDMLEWTFETQTDQDVLRQLFELRDIVEPCAAGLAAQRRTSADLEDLREALSAMTRFARATQQKRIIDQHFHAALLHASGNPYLTCLATGIKCAVDALPEFKRSVQPPAHNAISDYIKVFDAIVAKDVENARKAMGRLLRYALIDSRTMLAADRHV